MKERRRFLRIREEDAVTYCAISDYKDAHESARDLSLGGIRFLSHKFIPLHSILKVGIKLQHAPKIINAVVRLVWIKTIFSDECYEAGAEFIEISSEDLKFLERYIAETVR